MDKTLTKWFYADVIFILVIGTLVHFVYEWSGKNALVGIFGAVNESTWEHTKLFFWPTFLFSIIEYFYLGKNYDNYALAKAISYYVGVALIPILYYTYTGIIGEHYFVIDILIFIVSTIISQWIGFRILSKKMSCGNLCNLASILAILFLVLLFVQFTFEPPEIPLFRDPPTGTYGI